MNNEFELLRNVTIGQYIPTRSIVHRLDPRAKLLAAGLLVVALAVGQSVPAALLILLAILTVAVLARIPIAYLFRGLLPSLPLVLALILLQLVFQGRADQHSPVLWEWWFLRLTLNSVLFILVVLIRLASFLFLASLLTMTSTLTELTHGLERLLRPLRPFGVPAHELALVMTIAFRFVPTLAEELERLAKAQVSRGGNIGERNFWRPDRVLRARLPLIVPLFLAALRRGEDLIVAMEARCYVSGGRRSHLVQMRGELRDGLAVALVVCLLALVLWLRAWT